MAEDKDVIIPGNGNPMLDPATALDLHVKIGSRGDARYESSFERNSEGRLTHIDQLTANNAELEKMRTQYFDTDYASRFNAVKKTERIPPQRDLSGGGAKSAINPYKNSVSASGRIIADGKLSRLAQEAIGSMKNMVPMMGIPASSVSAGPFRFKGLTYNGAFPVLNLKQWDRAVTAAFSNMEDEE